MLQHTDLEARASHSAQPDYFLVFLALYAGAKSCIGFNKGRGDRLSFVGKGGAEVGRLGTRQPRPLMATAPQLSRWQHNRPCGSLPLKPRIETGPPAGEHRTGVMR